MKKNILLVAIASLLFASCVKDTPQETTIKAKSCNYFETTTGSLALNATGGTVQVDIKSNIDWTVSCDRYLDASETEGKGDGIVEISVPENDSFDAKTFSFSVSTTAELDVDDPKKWTEFGRKYEYQIQQAGKVKVFAVDKDELNVKSSDMTAGFMLIENVGFTIACSEGMDYTDKLVDGVHQITLQFPQNSTDIPVTRTATITPDRTDVTPSQIVVTVNQEAFQPVFKLDTNLVKVMATVDSAVVILSENTGYTVTCNTAGLTYTATDITASSHKLKFSFPKNNEETAKIYTATITPSGTFTTVSPITLTIKQAPNKTIVLDCTDATKFRYNDAGTLKSLPAAGGSVVHGKAMVECDFWLDGQASYIFHGSVMTWNKTLNAAKDSPVKLPAISGYTLCKVNVSYSHASSNRVYSLTDGTNTLGSITVNKSTGAGDMSINFKKAASEDRYLVSNGEMCVQFTLTYLATE